MVKDVRKDHDIGAFAVVVLQQIAFAERDDIGDSGFLRKFRRLRDRLRSLKNHRLQSRVGPAQRRPHEPVRPGHVETQTRSIGDGKFLRDEGGKITSAFRHRSLIEVPIPALKAAVDLDPAAGLQHIIEPADPLPLRRAEGDELSERIRGVRSEIFPAQSGQRPHGVTALDVAH